MVMSVLNFNKTPSFNEFGDFSMCIEAVGKI